MATAFSSVRGARPLPLILFLALLLHSDAAASSQRELQGNAAKLSRDGQDGQRAKPTPGADAEDPELPWYDRANATTDAKANNETDPVAAAIAKRMAAVGFSYKYAREWLSYRCPRREKDGTLSGIAQRCYDRGLRSLEEEALLRARPSPQLSPEDEARRRVVELLATSSIQVHPWPEFIRNPVIKTRYSPHGWPAPEFITNSGIDTSYSCAYGVPVL